MNIQKVAKEAIECGGSFYRKTAMCYGEEKRVVITLTAPIYTCTIVVMKNGVPIRSGKDWNPSMEDLIADDWCVSKQNVTTEKVVIRENSKDVEGVDMHKMTIQEAARAAMECNGGFYRKITIYEPTGRYIVVTPSSKRLTAPVVIIANGEPIYSCRYWAPTANDLIADDWSVLNRFEI